MIGTSLGMSIRFKVSDIRQVGRDSKGVRGVELKEGDAVVSMDVITDPDNQQVLTACANGYGKRTPVSEHRLQNRGGTGVIAIDASERNGNVVDLDLVQSGHHYGDPPCGHIIRTKVDEVREAGRNTQGVRIIPGPRGRACGGRSNPSPSPSPKARRASHRPRPTPLSTPRLRRIPLVEHHQLIARPAPRFGLVAWLPAVTIHHRGARNKTVGIAVLARPRTASAQTPDDSPWGAQTP